MPFEVVAKAVVIIFGLSVWNCSTAHPFGLISSAQDSVFPLPSSTHKLSLYFQLALHPYMLINYGSQIDCESMNQIDQPIVLN